MGHGIILTFTALWADSVQDKLIICSSYFSQNIGFDILCELGMKCQNLFYGEYILKCLLKFLPSTLSTMLQE